MEFVWLQLLQIIEYCIHHKDDPVVNPEEEKDAFDQRKRLEEIDEWDAEFVKVPYLPTYQVRLINTQGW